MKWEEQQSNQLHIEPKKSGQMLKGSSERFKGIFLCTTIFVAVNIVIVIISMNMSTSTTTLSGTIRASVFWNLIFYFPTLLLIGLIRAIEIGVFKLSNRVELLFKNILFRSLGIAAILILGFLVVTIIDTMNFSIFDNLSINSVIFCILFYLYSVIYCLTMKR